MEEKEKMEIKSLINNDLGDLRFIAEKIKNHYPYLKNNVEYRKIVDAINNIFDAEDELVRKLKE